MTRVYHKPQPYKPPEMSKRMKGLLMGGNDGTYKDDFNYEWAIALAAVNAGHSQAWLLKVLQDVGPHYHYVVETRGKGRADRYAEKLYAKAERFREQNPPWRSRSDVAADLALSKQWLQTLPNWKGRTGGRDLAVLLAVVDIGIEAGSTVVSFSTRQIRERVAKRMKRQTVGKALTSLTAEGWLKLETPAKGADAPTYRILFRPPMHLYGTTKTSLLSRGVGSSGPLEVHPLFALLGISAYRVWSVLDTEEGATVAEIVKATNLHRNTVSRALNEPLFSAGLALDKDGAWYRVDTDLDALAEVLGVKELQQERRRQHEEDRERWQTRLRVGKSDRQYWTIADWLKYHRNNDLLGDARNALVNPYLPALANAQPPRVAELAMV